MVKRVTPLPILHGIKDMGSTFGRMVILDSVSFEGKEVLSN